MYERWMGILMRRSPVQVLMVIGLAAMLVTACKQATGSPAPDQASPSPTSAEGEPVNTEAPGNTSEADPAGLACEHLLWPLRSGAEWVYRLSDGDQTEEVILISEVVDGQLTLRTDDQRRAVNCQDGALIGLPPGIVGHPQLGGQISGVPLQGSYLPPAADLLPLGTPVIWDLELSAQGKIQLPLADEPLSISGGRLVLFNSVSGLETITVADRLANALIIQQDIFFEIRVVLPEGEELEVLISTSTQQYYAENLGPVKTNYLGGTISSVNNAWTLPPGAQMELVSVTLQ